MSLKIIDRILKEAQVPGLMQALVNKLSLTDLQSLLLEIYRQRVSRLTPRDLLQQYTENRFVRPAQVHPQEVLAFDSLAFSLLPRDFEAVELSPVCPLGNVAIVSTVDQNNVLTTIRNTEVVADNTNVLALECALRRRALQSRKTRAQDRIKLCSSQRLLRTQMFYEPGAFPHFRIFSLCTAGRDEGSFRFEIESLEEQLVFYLELIVRCKELNLKISSIKTKLMIFEPRHQPGIESMIGDVTEIFPDISFEIDPDTGSGQGYYKDVRFQVFAEDSKNTPLLLVDGGFTDWTQQLLSNQKERLLISGLGSERLLACFKP